MISPHHTTAGTHRFTTSSIGCFGCTPSGHKRSTSLQLCQPVLRRPVRVSFAQLHNEHIQKTTSPRMPTTAGQCADGKIMWFEVDQKRDTPGKVREHNQSGRCRYLCKSIDHTCQRQGTEAVLVAVHTLCERRRNSRLHTMVRA